MRYISLFIFLIFACHTSAQVPDNAVEQLMTRRVISPAEVHANTLALIPRLYSENKTDTLEAVISYFIRQNGMYTNSTLTPFNIIRSIRERKFREELDDITSTQRPVYDTSAAHYIAGIFTYLNLYISNYKKVTDTTRYYYRNEMWQADSGYFHFLQSLAQSTLDKPGLSNVEEFLLRFFARPSDTLYAELCSPEYDHTLLKEAWLAYKKEQQKITFIDMGIEGGAWIPIGHLAALGAHPSLGLFVGGAHNRIIVDAEIDIRFLSTPHEYTSIVNNKLYSTDYYLGGYAGLNGSYQFYRAKDHDFSILAGIAYDGFDVNEGSGNSNNSNNSDNKSKSINSANLNAGIGYRYYLKHNGKAHNQNRRYVAVQAKYNVINYANDGGTNLSGNAFTLNFIYGSISLLYHNPHRYFYYEDRY